jgi:hypothetical protein
VEVSRHNALAGDNRDEEEERVVGSANSLLRRSLLIGAAAACAATAAPGVAHAGGLAPDPAPAEATLHPDAYPVSVVRVSASPAPAAPSPPVVRPVVAAAPVARPPRHRATTPTRRPAPHRRHVAAPHPSARLPFPRLAIKWFSGATAPAARAGHEVPVRVALLLAALVLASAAFVAGAAREVVR